ncbi:MAG: GNAT family N-acetyltransferase [Candidatus Saccharimonadales bacterium]
MIEYRGDRCPEPAAIAELCRAALLNRPVDDLERIGRIYAASNLVFTAWEGDRLVGVLRGWSDGGFDAYICDLAIHPDVQRQGVGRRLLELASGGQPQVQFILRASQIARDYYEHLGWQKIENGWFQPRTS